MKFWAVAFAFVINERLQGVWFSGANKEPCCFVVVESVTWVIEVFVSCCVNNCGCGSGGDVFGIGCGVRTGNICGVFVMVGWGPWDKVGPAWLLFCPIFFDGNSVGRTGSSCCVGMRGGPNFHGRTCSSGITNLGCGISHRGDRCYTLVFGCGAGGRIDGNPLLSSSSILSRGRGYVPMHRGLHVLVCCCRDCLRHCLPLRFLVAINVGRLALKERFWTMS